jgi:hypothetical protein
MSRCHNYPRKHTRINYEILGPSSILSVSLIRRQRRRMDENIFQGELRKTKPPTFNVEHRKGE